MKLFRQEAIDAKRRRLWGEVRLAQPPSYAVWTAVLGLTCLGIAITLVFGVYTRKETVPGFLMPEAGIVQVRTVQVGRVARVLVRDSQSVAAGTPLIEFVSDVGGAGRAPTLDLQLAESARQERSLDERAVALTEAYRFERRRLEEQISAAVQAARGLAAQRRVQQDALELSEQDARRMAELQSRGFAPNAQVDAKRRAVLAERSALGDMDARIDSLQATAADLRTQLAALPAREAGEAAALSADRAVLAQRRAELEIARGYLLRAPVAGVVSAVQARPGMTPTGDQPLLSLSPTGSPLEARLLVPTRAVGFLRVGQRARLQVEAFPYQRFGFVEGRVLNIATTVTRPGEAEFPITQSEPAYEVRVAVDKPYIDAYGARHALQAGMGLRADLPIDRRRLWQQVFDPLLAAARRAN